MIRNTGKYVPFKILKHLFCIGPVLLLCCKTTAQNIPVPKADTTKQDALFYYHSFTGTQALHPYTHINYARPDNQPMSWPNFPLTPTEQERRHRQYMQDTKPATVIAKDIITSMLKKKAKAAVIPKF